MSSDHHSTTAPQGDTTITIPAPDPLEPLREAVRNFSQLEDEAMSFAAVEREAARLVLRVLEANPCCEHDLGPGSGVLNCHADDLAYWRARA